MFNVILKVAAGAALTAAANYVAKATAEKLAKEPALVKAKEVREARKMADAIIDANLLGVKMVCQEHHWEFHQKINGSGASDGSTAMVVRIGEEPKLVFLQTRVVGDKTQLWVGDSHIADFNTVNHNAVLSSQINNGYILIEGFNFKP